MSISLGNLSIEELQKRTGWNFNTRDKTMMCAIYRKGDLVSRALAIFPDEFKAIQEQMKELGWLDE